MTFLPRRGIRPSYPRNNTAVLAVPNTGLGVVYPLFGRVLLGSDGLAKSLAFTVRAPDKTRYVMGLAP